MQKKAVLARTTWVGVGGIGGRSGWAIVGYRTGQRG